MVFTVDKYRLHGLSDEECREKYGASKQELEDQVAMANDRRIELGPEVAELIENKVEILEQNPDLAIEQQLKEEEE